MVQHRSNISAHLADISALFGCCRPTIAVVDPIVITYLTYGSCKHAEIRVRRHLFWHIVVRIAHVICAADLRGIPNRVTDSQSQLKTTRYDITNSNN